MKLDIVLSRRERGDERWKKKPGDERVAWIKYKLYILIHLQTHTHTKCIYIYTVYKHHFSPLTKGFLAF